MGTSSEEKLSSQTSWPRGMTVALSHVLLVVLLFAIANRSTPVQVRWCLQSCPGQRGDVVCPGAGVCRGDDRLGREECQRECMMRGLFGVKFTPCIWSIGQGPCFDILPGWDFERISNFGCPPLGAFSHA